MTTPIASLLKRLFIAADAVNPATMPTLAAYWSRLTREEIGRIMRSKTDYLDLYARLRDVPTAVSRETGTLLYMLARSIRARSMVEFGTSFGLSTLYLASALRDKVVADRSPASSSCRRSIRTD